MIIQVSGPNHFPVRLYYYGSGTRILEKIIV